MSSAHGYAGCHMDYVFPMKIFCLAVLLTASLSAGSTAPQPVLTVLKGRVMAEPSAGPASPDWREAVVFFRPDRAADEVLPGDPAEMRMTGKTFSPGVLAVTAGTTVRFPNHDPVLHNAFSTSGNSRFDLGFYGVGDSREVVFDQPGIVRVYCNVHHGMVGYVLVLDTPYFALADAQGRFNLKLPEGQAGRLYAWHPQADAVQRALTDVPDFLEIPLKLTGRRVPRHLNKHGKPYRNNSTRQY